MIIPRKYFIHKSFHPFYEFERCCCFALPPEEKRFSLHFQLLTLKKPLKFISFDITALKRNCPLFGQQFISHSSEKLCCSANFHCCTEYTLQDIHHYFGQLVALMKPHLPTKLSEKN